MTVDQADVLVEGRVEQRCPRCERPVPVERKGASHSAMAEHLRLDCEATS